MNKLLYSLLFLVGMTYGMEHKETTTVASIAREKNSIEAHQAALSIQKKWRKYARHSKLCDVNDVQLEQDRIDFAYGETLRKKFICAIQNSEKQSPQFLDSFAKCIKKNQIHARKSKELINYYGLLHQAITNNCKTLVRCLLDAGISSNLQDNSTKAAPLHVAAIHNRRHIAELLLARGANPNIRDHRGWTPMHSATRGQHPVIMRLLYNHGGSIDALNKHKATCLHDALCTPGITRIFVEWQAKLNEKDDQDRTPLQYGLNVLYKNLLKKYPDAIARYKESIILLVQAGAQTSDLTADQMLVLGEVTRELDTCSVMNDVIS